MFLFYVLSFFEKGDTIQGGTLFKEYSNYRQCDIIIILLLRGCVFQSMIVVWQNSFINIKDNIQNEVWSTFDDFKENIMKPFYERKVSESIRSKKVLIECC